MLKKSNLTIVFIILVIFAVFLIAWQLDINQSPRTKPNKVVEIESGDFFFKPSKLQFKEGDLVEFRFKNTGYHTFRIDEFGTIIQLAEGKSSANITMWKKGKFTFYCDVPGHKSSGQWGTLIVN